MGNWAKEDPECLLRWATEADKEADETENPQLRQFFRNWAIQLRKHYSENAYVLARRESAAPTNPKPQ